MEIVNKYIEIGYKNNNYFRRNIIVNPMSNEDIMSTYQDYDIFKTIYTYDNENRDDALLEAPLYLDLDIDNIEDEEQFLKIKQDLNFVVVALDIMFGIKKEMYNIYFSGNKGFHIYVHQNVFDVKPRKDLNIIYKTIATMIKNKTLNKTIDTKIYDNKRLLRICNSKHNASNLYKVLIPYELIKNSENFDKIKEYASSTKEDKVLYDKKVDKAKKKMEEVIKSINKEKKISNKTGAIKMLTEIPPCIKYIIENGVGRGCRNNVSVVLASSLLQSNYSVEEVRNILNEWNNLNDPPLPDREIDATIKSASAYFSNGIGYGCTAIRGLGYCIKGCKLIGR